MAVGNEPLKPIRVAGYIAQLLAIFLLVGQYGQHWFTFANELSGRLFVVLCFIIASIGNALLVYNEMKPMKAISVGLLTFVALCAVMFILGSVGLMSVTDPAIYQNSGFYFALDSLTSQVTEIAFLVKTIAQLVPTMILIIGIITIYVADSGDELQAGIIEIIVSIGVLVVFYFFGNYFGFTV